VAARQERKIAGGLARRHDRRTDEIPGGRRTTGFRLSWCRDAT
jgi:hypothetical protein